MIRQTVADLMQLVGMIQTGMYVDSDGTADFDPARITILGSSLRGNYGIPFQAVEGAIRASTVAFAGGSRADIWRFSNSRFQQSSVLQARIPSLLNLPGVTRIAGLAMAARYARRFSEWSTTKAGAPNPPTQSPTPLT